MSAQVFTVKRFYPVCASGATIGRTRVTQLMFVSAGNMLEPYKQRLYINECIYQAVPDHDCGVIKNWDHPC